MIRCRAIFFQIHTQYTWTLSFSHILFLILSLYRSAQAEELFLSISQHSFFGTFFASDQLYWLNPRSFLLQPFIFYFPYDCLHPILSSSSSPLSLQQQHLEQLSIWPNNEGKDKYFVENRLLDCYIYIYILLIHFCLTSGSARACAVTWVN